MLACQALADTIHKTNIQEHKEEEAVIRQHNSAEEEVPSVTLRRADFKDRRTELTAFSDKKPSVRKATANRDGAVVMSVDSDGDTHQEAPGVSVGEVVTFHEVEPIVCDEGQWQCKDASGCVRQTVLCDGLADCHDHSDEEKEACAKGNFAQVLAHSALKAELAMDEEEQKRYEILSVPGYIPPPREHYEDFYKSNFNLVKRFPRVTDSNSTMVEVYFLQAPINEAIAGSNGKTQTGVGFIGKNKHTGEELFRRDYQYWAASMSKTYGPNWLKNGDLELNDDGDRVAFRARAMVSSTRTHGKWSSDWKLLKPQHLGDIDGFKFNEVMDTIDRFGHDNKYWQAITVKRHKDVVQPAIDCHTFSVQVLSHALGENENDIMKKPEVVVHKTTYEVVEHQLTRDPVRCLAPYVDPIDGVGEMLDKAQMYNARFLFSFFMGKKLTLPQRYMPDGTALEESDFPAECQEFRIKKIVTETTGKNGMKEEVKAPRVPDYIQSTAGKVNRAYQSMKRGFETVNMAAKEQIAAGFANTLLGKVGDHPAVEAVNQATRSVLEVAENAAKGRSPI
jgi:hypothetical protein